MTPFHLAFPIRDIEQTRHCYGEVLGCPMGHFTETWIDFDLFGHQMSAHVRPDTTVAPASGVVDGHSVPIPHFGAVLLMNPSGNALEFKGFADLGQVFAS